MKIKTAVIQMRVDTAAPDKNIETGLNFIQNAALFGAKLIVMPEMWVTGFHPALLKSEYIARTPEILDKIRNIARNNKATIISGSFAAREPGAPADAPFYNRIYVIDSKGEICGSYDKVHLFKMIGENDYTYEGGNVKVIEADGIKIAPLICFDLRFPELFRIAAFNGAEVITVSAQFPTSRIGHWKTLIPARAVENQSYVLSANTNGFDGILGHGGHSMTVSPDGEVLANCMQTDGVGFCDIDIDEMRSYRAKFPFTGEAALKDEMAAFITRKNLK